MSGQTPTQFDSFSKLPPHLIPTSIQVLKYAGAHVKHKTNDNQDNLGFDWISFKTSIDNNANDDLAYDRYNSTTIGRGESTVKSMADKIVHFLLNVLSINRVGDFVESLTSTIEATFTNLKEKSADGFLDFHKSIDGRNSFWQYRVQFAFPNPDLPDELYSLVTTIDLKANISSESGWWDLVASSSKEFSASINAMRLVVREGFKSPK